MDLEKQVCSLKLAKELKELGVEQTSQWGWLSSSQGNWILARTANCSLSVWHSAFTVAELGDLLSDYLYVYRARIGDVMIGDVTTWFGNNGNKNVVEAYTEADAKAKLLIWQMENGVARNGSIDPLLLPDDVSCTCFGDCDCDEIASNPPYPVTPIASVLWSKKYIVDDCDSDVINHPDHYTSGGMEVIDFIEAKQLGYHLGNAVKYIVRAGKKDNYIEDLEKVHWYVERAIQDDSDHYTAAQDKQLTEDFIIAKDLSYLLGYVLQHIVHAGESCYVSYDLKKVLGYIQRAIDAVEE